MPYTAPAGFTDWATSTDGSVGDELPPLTGSQLTTFLIEEAGEDLIEKLMGVRNVCMRYDWRV